MKIWQFCSNVPLEFIPHSKSIHPFHQELAGVGVVYSKYWLVLHNVFIHLHRDMFPLPLLLPGLYRISAGHVYSTHMKYSDRNYCHSLLLLWYALCFWLGVMMEPRHQLLMLCTYILHSNSYPLFVNWLTDLWFYYKIAYTVALCGVMKYVYWRWPLWSSYLTLCLPHIQR